jgi:SNW domain-containing protein 1
LQVHINDNFAKFSEALFVADRHARDEVRQRALMQQKIAAKEKAAKEENLRLLAQRARDDRAGIPSAPLPSKATETGLGGALGGALGGYGSGSDDSSSDSDSAASGAEDDEDNEEVRERERMRREKKQEREREMRLNNMGNEKRAIMMAKWVPPLPPEPLLPDSPKTMTDRLLPASTSTESRTATSRRRWRLASPSRRRARRR